MQVSTGINTNMTSSSSSAIMNKSNNNSKQFSSNLKRFNINYLNNANDVIIEDMS